MSDMFFLAFDLSVTLTLTLAHACTLVLTMSLNLARTLRDFSLDFARSLSPMLLLLLLMAQPRDSQILYQRARGGKGLSLSAARHLTLRMSGCP